MKVSLNIVKQYTEVNLSVDELVARINSQLGGVEEVIDLGAKYSGATIARIVSCEKHPGADRLHVCQIDVGDNPQYSKFQIPNSHLIQVVCGAPNARAGLTVVWLPPGATVPASYHDKEPFVLDTREIRGVVSNGMLASPKELALGDDHGGILAINDDKKPGESFAVAYGLDDTILDIENKMFTHRPDCFGVLGVAREIAGIQHQQFVSPAWYTEEPGFVSGDGLNLSVTNEIARVVPRFMAVAIRDIEITPSPLWLQAELIRLGGRAVNNIVDVTNYCMLQTGQPLHAYDYDKVATGKLSARFGHEGEKITLLGGKTIDVTVEDMVITDGDKPIGLAGVMGGADTEVSSETKNIILECATFDMYTIRKTSMRHGLFTDAVTRFNKGQSPLQNQHVLSVAVDTIRNVAGGAVASQIFDQSDELKPHAPVSVDVAFINERLGTNLKADEAAHLLRNVECSIAVNKNTLAVTPPFWRTDIVIPEDVVEEVGRLHGFDRLPRELPRRSIAPVPKSELFEMKRRVREILSRAGANEVLTYSFVHENLLKKTGQDASQAFRLSNALSPDLQYYRLSVLPSLLDKVHANIKAGHDEFVLFEIGKAHGKSEVDNEGLPKEFGRVAGVFAANKKAAAVRRGAPYYAAKCYAGELLSGRNILYQPLERVDSTDHVLFQQMASPFEPSRSAGLYDGEKLIGVLGEFRVEVRQALKLPEYSAGFELFLSAMDSAPARPYQPLSRFPGVTQDVSLTVEEVVAYGELEQIVNEVIGEYDHNAYFITLTPRSIYRPENSDKKTITFRLTVSNYERTLTDGDAAQIIDKIAARAAQKIDATYV